MGFTMPYVKDGIGISPRYIYAVASRNYLPTKCETIAKTLDKINIPLQKRYQNGICTIYFGDSYEAYVDSLMSKHSLAHKFPFLM